jgi:hypothetical protein
MRADTPGRIGMNKLINAGYAGVCLLVVTIAGHTQGQTGVLWLEPYVASANGLEDLGPIRLLVEDPPGLIVEAGISREWIQSSAESELQGIGGPRVVDSDFGPTVSVRLTGLALPETVDRGSGGYAVYVHVGVSQAVYAARTREGTHLLLPRSETWETGSLVVGYRGEDLRGRVSGAVKMGCARMRVAWGLLNGG